MPKRGRDMSHYYFVAMRDILQQQAEIMVPIPVMDDNRAVEEYHRVIDHKPELEPVAVISVNRNSKGAAYFKFLSLVPGGDVSQA